MKNEVKFLVVVDLNINAKHVVNSLEKEGYEITSDINTNDIEIYRVKKKIGARTPINIPRFTNEETSTINYDNVYCAPYKDQPFSNKQKDNHQLISFNNYSYENEQGYKKSRIKKPLSENSITTLDFGKDTRLVEKACHYLIKEIGQKHTLNGLSRELVTNRNTLSKAFKNTLGLGVFGWLRQQRINKAALLLKNTTLCIQAISYEVGYNDQANFSTAFRKITGTSPKQYRNDYIRKIKKNRLNDSLSKSQSKY